jgi:hypothetical protein
MTAAVGWLWGYKPARVNIPGTSVNIVEMFGGAALMDFDKMTIFKFSRRDQFPRRNWFAWISWIDSQRKTISGGWRKNKTIQKLRIHVIASQWINRIKMHLMTKDVDGWWCHTINRVRVKVDTMNFFLLLFTNHKSPKEPTQSDWVRQCWALESMCVCVMLWNGDEERER